jgi:hypothetical protein
LGEITIYNTQDRQNKKDSLYSLCAQHLQLAFNDIIFCGKKVIIVFQAKEQIKRTREIQP